MATRRMISSTLWEDEFIGEINFFQRCLWIGLFSACADDQGRLLDNLILIRSKIFLYDDVSLKDIEEGIDVFNKHGKIIRYQKDGKKYIQIINWWGHQRPQWASRSKFPAQDGWTDRVRSRENGKYIEENWKESAEYEQNESNHSGERSGECSPEQPSRSVQVVRQSPVPVPVPVPVPIPVPDPIPVQKKSNIPVPVAGSLNTDENIYRVYEGNIGALTPIIADRLDMDVADYSFEWVSKAIELAVVNEARNLAYIEAILARWKKDGFGVDKRQPKQARRVQIDPYGNKVEI